MPRATFTVCVYCASSDDVGAGHRRTAAQLGRGLAERGWGLVYGGGAVGLMGEVARAALAGGAHVTGVIPHRLDRREIALWEVSELIRTDTMRERKAIMDARSDAFIILPGGIGTLEELVEMLTLKQLGYHARPVVVLDDGAFWDPLVEQLRRMVDARLAVPTLLDLWTVVADVAAALDAAAAPTVAPVTADEEEALEALPDSP